MATVSICSREIIKPSSLTPPHLRTCMLSMTDQFMPMNHAPVIFFYSSSASTAHPPAVIVAKLKRSLSHALALFYPLAGRFHERSSAVVCSDEGVPFLEARVPGVDLSSLLENPQQDLRRQLVPCEVICTIGCPGGVLLAVQATAFACGGIALGICMSHKIADGLSFLSFLRSWSAAATTNKTNTAGGSGDIVLSSDHFPPLTLVAPVTTIDRIAATNSTVERRFVVDGPKLAALRSSITLGDGEQPPTPTRVEAVSTLFWQAMIRAQPDLGPPGQALAVQMIDMSRRMAPHVTGNRLGNFSLPFPVREAAEGRHQLVAELRKVVREVGEMVRAVQGPQMLDFMDKIRMELVRSPIRCCFSSWCRFPVYEIDFGWGKPALVAFGGTAVRSSVVMVDRREGDGGVEVWVSAEQEGMERLFRDVELLSHASLC